MSYVMLANNFKKARRFMENHQIFKMIEIKYSLSATVHVSLNALKKFENTRKQFRLTNTVGVLDNSSSSEILKDSIKGILMLQTTYDLNITKLANAEVAIDERKIPLHTRMRHERLIAKDLIAIGKQAFMYGWYDTAILFILEAYNMSIRKKETFEVFDASKRILTSVVAYHNRKLLEYGSTFGENWKAFDYLVHIGIYCHKISFCIKQNFFGSYDNELKY